MTIRELIALLQVQDNQDQRVVVNGYEGGYSDIDRGSLRQERIKLNRYREWYYGTHGEVYGDSEPYDEIVVCIRASKAETSR